MEWGIGEQNQVIPETAVWNGDTVAWNQDRAMKTQLKCSQIGWECDRDQIASLQLTNQLLD